MSDIDDDLVSEAFDWLKRLENIEGTATIHAAMNALVRARPGGADVSDETGWLIELNTSVPLWWSLTIDEPGWTPDCRAALRFARRQDAEAYIADIGWTEAFAVDAFATEHMWPPARAPEEQP